MKPRRILLTAGILVLLFSGSALLSWWVSAPLRPTSPSTDAGTRPKAIDHWLASARMEQSEPIVSSPSLEETSGGARAPIDAPGSKAPLAQDATAPRKAVVHREPEAMRAAALAYPDQAHGFSAEQPWPEAEATFIQQLREREEANRREALRRAALLGWVVRGVTAQGRVFELKGIDLTGHPIYHITTNANAAISTGVTLIRNVSPYNSGGSLSGSGFRAGVWDEAAVRATHQELTTARTFVMDGVTSRSNHATHVAGTIGASGVTAAAKGMAPGVRINSYDWNSDISEMASAGANTATLGTRLPVSNHSYGLVCGWDFDGSAYDYYGKYPAREDETFGRYSGDSTDVDQVVVNNPYYLPFIAAGNDRTDTGPAPGGTFRYLNANGSWVSKAYSASTDPRADGYDNGGFDTIGGGLSVAKNVVTIGAVNDAVSAGARQVSNATVVDFSGWGPVDDGRIKPDLVANGAGVYSSVAGSNSAYATYSGTSMAAPNATGSALLLQQLYSRKFGGELMRGSTLKALLIHSADDRGNPGPDYSYGWGLINVKRGADVILAHSNAPAANTILQGELNTSNPDDAYTITWDGTSPVRATLCWTDPARAEINGLDNTTPALVNDLDLRITRGGSVFFPYRLDVASPASNATQADNTVDNVEQVLLASPSAGTYTVTVSRKGSLSGSLQRYSLIITGQSGSPSAPVLAAGPASLAQSVNVGLNATSQSITVRNSGQGTLSYTVTDDASWLAVNPDTGTSAGETDTLPVSYNSATLAAGVYQGQISVRESGGGSATIPVTLTVLAPTVPLATAVDVTGVTLGSEGNAPWTGQMLVSADGVDAGRSGAISDNQASSFTMPVTGPGQVNFSWRTDSEPGADKLFFDIDGVPAAELSGSNAWTNPSFNVTAGDHILRWRYAKNASGAVGEDAGFVDQIVYVRTLPLIERNPTHLYPSVTQGLNPASQTFTVRNGGSGTLSYSITDNVAWMSVAPSTGTSTGEVDTINANFATSSLTAGSYTGTIAISGGTGVASETITVQLTVNPAGSTVNFADAVDFPGTSWTQGGEAGWIGQTGITRDGVDAGRSGALTHNQMSTASTNVTGPGTIRFWWRVDSEGGYDFLNFKVGGTTVAYISGSTTWQQVTQEIPAGPSTLTWSYEKDESVHSGADAGWLDQVAYSGAQLPSPALSSPGLSFTAAQGTQSTQSVGVSNAGGGTLSYSIATTQPWLSTSPTSGTATTETDSIDVTVNAMSLSPGQYAGQVNASGGGTTVSFPVTLQVLASSVTPVAPARDQPYTQSFASAALPSAAQGWSFYSTNEGRIAVVSGTLRLDDSVPASAVSLNEAVLHANLAGKTGVSLTFRHREFSDEFDALPASFSGHAEGDGVSISADGVTWYPVDTLALSDANWRTVSVDLDAAIAAASISFTTDFRVKFQQYDDYPVASDGFEFDDIAIRLNASTDDHGNTPATATVPADGVPMAGNLETAGDQDYFRIDVASPGELTVFTTGATDTLGDLILPDESVIAADDDSGDGLNFLIVRSVPAGSCYVRVRGYQGTARGAYTIVASVTTLTSARPVAPGTPDALPSLSAVNPWSAPSLPLFRPFEGLLQYASPDGAEYCGQARIVFDNVTESGFTGSIYFLGLSYGIRGAFDPLTGAWDGQATRRGSDPLTLHLELRETMVDAAYGMEGTVSGGGIVADARLREAYGAGGTPGRYTFLIPAPEDAPSFEPGGDGYGSLEVSATGVFTLSGVLGDRTRFSDGGKILTSGETFLYRALYATSKPPGWIGGPFSFRSVLNVSEFDGRLQWKKPMDLARYYPDGFKIERPLIGAPYTVPASAGAHALSVLPAGPTTAWITFDEGDITPPLGRYILNVAPRDLVTPSSRKFSLKIDRRTGLFSGSVKRPSDRSGIPFGGAILQLQGLGGGYFGGQSHTGSASLQPPVP